MGAVADTVKYFCWASAGVFTFFAIALLVDPEAFFGPNSVLCYYTEWDAATTWFGKGLGVVILSSVWSPYYAGVSYEQYTRWLMPLMIINLGMFTYPNFESWSGPGPNNMMGMSMWPQQSMMGVTFLIWCALACKSLGIPSVSSPAVIKAPKDGATYFCWTMLALYGFIFGLPLATMPVFMFGPSSMLCYWTTWGPAGVWFGRAMGFTFLTLFLSPLYAGVSYASLARISIMPNLFYLAMFFQAAFVLDITGPGPNALLPISLWYMQLPLGFFLIAWNIYVLNKAPLDAKSLL